MVNEICKEERICEREGENGSRGSKKEKYTPKILYSQDVTRHSEVRVGIGNCMV
jgi:hypothetical protein